jgi:LmbE family N-acetylglucosaminyl deacetylase
MLWACALAAQTNVVVAIGAHAGDMEVTAGAALARAARQGARVVIVHLTLGENGHPRKAAEEYASQKRKEAEAAAKELKAEVRFGKWSDGSLRSNEEAEAWVAEILKEVKATHVITHWKRSIHPDHEAAHVIATNAVLRASIGRGAPVRSVWFAENWEDAEEFRPYLYLDTAADMDTWRKAVACYEFLRGGVSPFPHLQYYEGMSMVRGAEARKRNAVAFDVDSMSKRRVLEAWP